MFDFIIDHAEKNVWCNPEQDRQYTFIPYRVSPKGGSLNYCNVMMRDIVLPTKKTLYHVFQIGQMPTITAGIFTQGLNPSIEEWTSISTCMNREKMIIDVYTDSGIMLPRFETYYMVTEEKNFIFAVKQNNKISVDLKKERICIKVYSNAFFETSRADAIDDIVYTEGMNVKSSFEILASQMKYLALNDKPGLTNAYVNGFLVKEISPVTAVIGDTIEWVYDSSVRKVVTFTVADLPMFESSLDRKRKYLLHHVDDAVKSIDYYDDIDIFIVRDTSPNQTAGVYYHHNAQDSCRMVTHHDYSIVVQYFQSIASKLGLFSLYGQIDFRQLKIRMHVRNSGYLRPLIFENSRLHELYKLPDADVKNAMLGIDSSVTTWRADEMEAGAYTALMRAKPRQINRQMVQDAYGYNGIAKVVGDTPQKTYEYSGRQQVAVPYGLQQFATAYEYDSNGILLGYHHHDDGAVYNAIDDNCRLVELISGRGEHTPDVYFGTDNLPVSSDYNYRVYMSHFILSPEVDGLVCDEKWVDITDSEHYVVINNRLIWQNLDYNQFLMVRTDAKFLAYNLSLRPIDGNIRFSLSEMQARDGIEYLHHVMPIPMGELDIFLEGRSLIQNVDYVYRFPEIVILNKSFLKPNPNTAYHDIHVRFTGFCTSDLQLNVATDKGFIEHAVLSNNKRYDIRDDKVQRIVVNGGLRHKEDLIFSEFHSGVSVVNGVNGQPYSVRDIVVPLKRLVNDNTYTLRKKSLIIDTLVSGYISRKLPQPPRDAPSAIIKRYEVISPFITKLLYDLVTEHLDKTMFDKHLTDNEVLDICKPYEDWLKFDPTQSHLGINHNYIIVHPHNHYNVLTLNLFQYRFLTRVVKLYCNGYVELSPFIALEQF
jgi:hypothetical protein